MIYKQLTDTDMSHLVFFSRLIHLGLNPSLEKLLPRLRTKYAKVMAKELYDRNPSIENLDTYKSILWRAGHESEWPTLGEVKKIIEEEDSR